MLRAGVQILSTAGMVVSRVSHLKNALGLPVGHGPYVLNAVTDSRYTCSTE